MNGHESDERLRYEIERAAHFHGHVVGGTARLPIGYSLSIAHRPVSPLGNDVYQCCTDPKGRALLVVAEVTGADIIAALGAAYLAGAMRLRCERYQDDLPTLVRILNWAVLSWTVPMDRFVNLVALTLDATANCMRLLSAGHSGIMLKRRCGQVEQICDEGKQNLPLGLMSMDEFPFEKSSVELLPGDALVIASSGVTAALSATDELYGSERLQLAVGRNSPLQHTFGEAILSDVREHSSGRKLGRDLFLVWISRAV